MIDTRWILGLMTALCCVSAFPQVTAYRGAKLIDGTGTGAVEEATILVDGDRFIAVGANVPMPDDAIQVDLSGMWVVPGMIDAHVHFMTSGRMYTRPAFFDLTHKVSYGEEIEFIKRNIPDTLRANMSRSSTMMEAMLWYADWRDYQHAVVAEAANHGMQVTTHAHAMEYARGAVEAGVASLQHVVADQPVDQAFIDLLKQNDVVVTPTLAIRKRTFIELFTKELELLPIEHQCSVPGVLESFDEPIPAADSQSSRYRKQGEIAAANVKTLYEAGVALAVATDTGMIGIPHGSGMHLELRDLNRAGVPAEYLIHAATYN